MLSKFSREPAGHLPTPLEPAARLSQALGTVNLYIKRDDATGLAGGGNKVRKLEYLLGAARTEGANCLVTVGGPQSNHARMTAALAARFGFACRLYLKGKRPSVLRGNLLLDKILGAETVFCGNEDYPAIYRRIEADTPALQNRGLKPYIIPVGGSTAIGALGYVRMVLEELAPQCRQLGLKPAAIALAAGSGGTMAGLLLGLALAGWDVPVRGYSVIYPALPLKGKVAEIFNSAAELLSVRHRIMPAQVDIDSAHIGPGYGVATPGALEALALFARQEGLLLDSVYTAKAAAGMIADIRRSCWEGKQVVFIHTGGWPALFAKDDVHDYFHKEISP